MAAERPSTRTAIVRWLAETIDALERLHPVRVAIDGPDAAGKTTLADKRAFCVSWAAR
jgi:uridine kinase